MDTLSSFRDPEGNFLRYMNVADPKKRETTVMWELQVMKTLDLPSADVEDVGEDQGIGNRW